MSGNGALKVKLSFSPGQIGDPQSVSPRGDRDRHAHAGMLELRGDDVIARFPVDTPDHDVEPGRGVRGDGHVVGCPADEGGRRLAQFDEYLLGDGHALRPHSRHPKLGGHRGMDRVGDRARQRARSPGVEIDLVVEQRELGPDLGDVDRHGPTVPSRIREAAEYTRG